MNRYKNPSGNYPEKVTLDNKPAVRNAMEYNKRRFEDSFTKGMVDNRFHEFKNTILTLRDGETTMLNKNGVEGGDDYWDRDLKYKDYAGAGDWDGLTSLGHAKLNSRGNFRATRRGNAVVLNGYVNHRIDDDYNFNPDDVYYDHYYRLEKEGKARSFLISGNKREKLKGKFIIKDDDIGAAKFEWSDMD